MVRKLIAWALDNPLVVILLAVFLAVDRHRLLHERQRRGLPRPGAGHRRSDRAVSRRIGRGGRAAGHHPPGSDFRRHARLEENQQQVAVRPERPQDDLALRQQYTYQAARQEVINRMATISPAAAGQRHAGHFAGVAHRRNLPLCPQGPQGRFRPRDLHAQRHQGDAGLGAGARVSHRAADRRRHQLRRHGAALRGSARPGPPPPLRHHAGPAPDDAGQQQRHRGRRLPQPGPGRHDGAQRRPVRRRRGPGEQGAGAEEPVRRRLHPPRGGTAADPGNPQPGHHLGQQPADPCRGRGRGGPAFARAVARRAGRGRQPPDAPGADRLLEGRPRAALGISPFAQGRRSRRGRHGAVHRAAAQGRGHVARLERRQGQGRAVERSGLRPDVARDADRDLLRPHRTCSTSPPRP